MRYFCFVVLSLSLIGCATKSPKVAEYQVGSTLWHQTSGEFRALSYQAYNLAKYRLDRILRQRHSKPVAVVADVDQTLLDGSPYQAKMIREDNAYPNGWREYVELANGQALPGALEFFKYVHKRGVKIYYVTNRKEVGEEATIRNLKKVGFPQVSNESVMTRTGTSSKEPRRDEITRKYEIVLLIGDNLGDFDKAYDVKTVAGRNQAVDSDKRLFGERYIVLPNAMYGAWEGAVYDFNWGLSASQKNDRRRTSLVDPEQVAEE